MSRCSSAPRSRQGSILIVIRVLRGVDGEALSRVKHEVKIGMTQSVHQYSQKEITQTEHSLSGVFKTTSA